jgi:hypothetical protein
VRIALIILAIFLSLISLLLIGICIYGLIQYSGQPMGNEAGGFESFFTALAFGFTFPTIFLWVYIFSKRNRQVVKGERTT